MEICTLNKDMSLGTYRLPFGFDTQCEYDNLLRGNEQPQRRCTVEANEVPHPWHHTICDFRHKARVIGALGFQAR